MTQASQIPTPSLPEVLLLSESEALASLEKRALREAGVPHIHSMTSGIEAARLLAELTPGKSPLPLDCIVVCGQKLADMEGERFCALVRLHPRLLGLPILLILANDGELEQLRTLGCGASALMARPYTVPNLQAHLQALAANKPALDELARASQQASLQNFDTALATYGELLKPKRQPDDYFRVGMQCLQQCSWNNAIAAFQRALQSQLIKGEAEMGIAAAWKGKGDLPRFHAWLARAAETFVRAERWNAARAAFGRLTQDNPNAKNPFVKCAREQIQAGQYDAAAETLAQGYEVTPKDQLSRSWARICMAAPNPEAMLRKLEASLNGQPAADSGQIGAMSDAVHAQMDSLHHEQTAHRREESARRQAELARNLGVGGTHREAQNEPAQGNAHETPGVAGVKGRTKTVGIEVRESPLSLAEELSCFRTPKGAAAPLVLDDLPVLRSGSSQRTGQRSDMWPGLLQDVFSVMKFTWRLARY